MKKLILLLLFCIVSLSESFRRIYFGEVAPEGVAPWIAAILITDQKIKCGGAIIGEKAVSLNLKMLRRTAFNF